MDLPDLDFHVIGQKLRKAREDKGISQNDLAALTGIAQSCIHLLESGQTRNPSVMTLLKVAYALDIISLDFLLFNKELIISKSDMKIISMIQSPLLPKKERSVFICFLKNVLEGKEKKF